MVERTIAEVAALVGGRIVHGSGAGRITRVMPIDGASQDAISFVTKQKFLPVLASTKAGAVMTSAKLWSEGEISPPSSTAIILVEHPYAAFAKAAQLFARPIPVPETGVHPSAAVDPSAKVADDARIGPFVLIGAGATIGARAVLHAGAHVHDGAWIGEDTVLFDHAVVRHGCTIGARCILHPGVVIGADGFGFAQEMADEEVVHLKIPQTGMVVVEDDVEIGANACVDRAALGITRIGAGTKIDNLVQVGHNVEIGAACLLVAQSGVAGSSRLGPRVTLGAQSGISGHVDVGEGVTVFGQAGVMSDVEPHTKMAGTPARPAAEFFRTVVRLTKLEELSRKLKALEKLIVER